MGRQLVMHQYMISCLPNQKFLKNSKILSELKMGRQLVMHLRIKSCLPKANLNYLHELMIKSNKKVFIDEFKIKK